MKTVNPNIFSRISLREKQRDVVVNMLNYNNLPDTISLSNSNINQLWKVLIFDEFGQDVVSLIFKVNDLREKGVTLHMPIKAQRMPIPDVPAIYFLQPTQENVDRIINDIKQNLYESYYINFISMLPRPLLENFADQAVQNNLVDKIQKVYDQYLSFLTPENNLFSLNLSNSFYHLNSAAVPDNVVKGEIDLIVNGLTSILATLDQVPLIKASKNGPAHMVAEKLERRLKDLSRSGKDGLFTPNISPHRPILLILDRNFDLIPMLHHSWNYMTLVQDLLDIKLNRISIIYEENGKDVTQKFDIDSNDFFWAKHSMLPFHSVAEEIDNELTKYKKDADDLTRVIGVDESGHSADFITGDTPPHSADLANNTKHLKSAVTALPELTARKSVLDMHMNIATELLASIQKRHVDQLVQLEESILKQTKQSILDFLLEDQNDPRDKLRLFLVYYLSRPNINSDEVKEFKTVLTQVGCSLKAFEYIERTRSFSRMSTVSAGNASTPSFANLSSPASNLLNRLGSKLRDEAYGSILSGVKNFLPQKKDLAVTRMAESIFDPSSTPPIEDLITLDPKVRINSAKTPSAVSPPPQLVILFVVGGGTYSEYVNLQEYVKTHTNRTVVYGSTDLMSPEKFLKEAESVA
jgi:hypothetical protein